MHTDCDVVTAILTPCCMRVHEMGRSRNGCVTSAESQWGGLKVATSSLLYQSPQSAENGCFSLPYNVSNFWEERKRRCHRGPKKVGRNHKGSLAPAVLGSPQRQWGVPAYPPLHTDKMLYDEACLMHRRGVNKHFANPPTFPGTKRTPSSSSRPHPMVALMLNFSTSTLSNRSIPILSLGES